MRVIIIFLISLTGCAEEKQFYSRHFHNQSNQEIRSLSLDWNDGTKARLSGGLMIPKSVDIMSYLYIRPSEAPVLRWEDLSGKKYEFELDLIGVFPTDYNGGDFHVTIEEDFSVSYGFVFLPQIDDAGNIVTERVVYSPENRTAK